MGTEIGVTFRYQYGSKHHQNLELEVKKMLYAN